MPAIITTYTIKALFEDLIKNTEHLPEAEKFSCYICGKTYSKRSHSQYARKLQKQIHFCSSGCWELFEIKNLTLRVIPECGIEYEYHRMRNLISTYHPDRMVDFYKKNKNYLMYYKNMMNRYNELKKKRQ
jgi:predicted RNA-binding Zn-ribbon protein involved in translation (DUF1610 family)